MNATIPFLLLSACATLALPLSGAFGPRVLETETEFFTWGDFNGDGMRDYVVVDRATGALRTAYGRPDGGLNPARAQASGIAGVSDVAVGRFFSQPWQPDEALALVSPEANRCNLVRTTARIPETLFFHGIGPRYVTAVDLPGGREGRHDLVGVTVLNEARSSLQSAATTYSRYRSFMLNGNTFTFLKTDGTNLVQVRPLDVVLDAGMPRMYATFQIPPGQDTLSFFVFDTREPSVPLLTGLSGFNAATRVVYAPFQGGSTRSVFVFHVPGAAEVDVAAQNAEYTLQPSLTHDLGIALERISVVESLGVPYLAGIEKDGTTIRLFAIHPKNHRFALVETLRMRANETLAAALPLEGGGLLAVLRDPVSGRSTGFTRFPPDGQNPFVRGGTFALESIGEQGMSADILLYDGKPFEVNNPRLTGRLHAGGWTSELNDDPVFPSFISARVESFRSPEGGLGDKSAVHLGFAPADVRHGIANQFAPDVSIVSLEPASGWVPDLIRVDPPGGFQPHAIEVTLTAASPATSIYYSLDALNRWRPYAHPIGPIMAPTTIHFFGEHGGRLTPLQSVRYSFPENPAAMDADDDGVPDFVETYLGLDPIHSGPDSDGDGVPDLLEILAGTDPLDDTDYPDDDALRPFAQRFDIRVTPYSHPGMPHNESYQEVPSLNHYLRMNGTLVSLHRPDGALETEGFTMEPFMQPSVDPLFRVLGHTMRDAPRYLVATTPNRFPIDIVRANRLRGREIVGLLTYEVPALGDFSFIPDPAHDPDDAAQAWIEAARAHYLARSLVTVEADIRFQTTVDLLLVEYCLGRIFYARRSIPVPRLTLTPFRGDTGRAHWSGVGRGIVLFDRYPMTAELLESLSEGSAVDPGYLWNDLVTFVRAGVSSENLTHDHLLSVAREIHRIASYPMDPENPIHTAPLDALRHFIDEGVIHTEYAPHFGLDPKIALMATAYVTALPAALPTRNYLGAGILLIWENASPSDGMPVMTGVHDGLPYRLADALGRPLQLPTALHLLSSARFYATGHVEYGKDDNLLAIDHITLVDAPTPKAIDSIGNLLSDAWESFHFGYLGVDAFRDHDGDGYSTLQEFFEKTDPRDPMAQPPVARVDLRPPALHFDSPAFGEFHIGFQWSPLYQGRVAFSLHAGEDLESFLRLEPVHPPSPSGVFLFHDIPEDTPSIFYRVGMELR